MHTLVGEGIGDFRVVERWHLLVGLEVFSFLESLWGRILRDPFLIGIPLDFTKHGEQVIFLYTWYVGSKQPFIRIISLVCPFSLNAVNFMKASTFECLVKYFFTSSPPMNAMEADGCKRDRQPTSSPQSVGLFLTVSISYFLPYHLTCSVVA